MARFGPAMRERLCALLQRSPVRVAALHGQEGALRHRVDFDPHLNGRAPGFSLRLDAQAAGDGLHQRLRQRIRIPARIADHGLDLGAA